MFPEKGVLSAVVGTVRRYCRDYAAGLEDSSTGEFQSDLKCLYAKVPFMTLCRSGPTVPWVVTLLAYM